ncbi:MAG: hypothetical protein LBJ46_03445 [Planctomycetota bacterium]|nr:hypothetical protein [Planctomycetota bacterium]
MSLFAALRISQAFLAVSTVLAGYCLFRFYAYTAGNQRVVPYLLAAGGLLAVANSAWRALFRAAREPKDLNDVEPRGVSTSTLFLVAAFCTVGGLMCAMTGGYGSFRSAGVLAIFMLSGTALFQGVEILSPVLGGLTHGMFFVIGMTAHPAFDEMLYIQETRLPPVFFAVYMTVTAVLAQVRDSAKPRNTPEGDDLSNETASRLLTMRDDVIDGFVVWFGGAALVIVPAAAIWIMPLHWLSIALFLILLVTVVVKLIPVLVYRTRKDLAAFIESTVRGGCLLNAGVVASLGAYQPREIYDGLFVSLPSDEELAAVAVILLLAGPAWLLGRVSEGEA